MRNVTGRKETGVGVADVQDAKIAYLQQYDVVSQHLAYPVADMAEENTNFL